MRAALLLAALALAACTGPDPGAEPEDPPARAPAPAPAEEDTGVRTTGYAEIGVGSGGTHAGGGFTMHRGNFSLGFEL